MNKFYKFLNDIKCGTYQTHFYYGLFMPIKHTDGTYVPGPWLPPVSGDLKLCHNGYHATRPESATIWADTILVEVEIGEEFLEEANSLDHQDKVCARNIRILSVVEGWNINTARLLAADCVERLLLAESDYKDGDVVVEAIKVAREYAQGKASKKDLEAIRWKTQSIDNFANIYSAARSLTSTTPWEAMWIVTATVAFDTARKAILDARVKGNDVGWAEESEIRRETEAKEIAWQAERMWQYIRGEV